MLQSILRPLSRKFENVKKFLHSEEDDDLFLSQEKNLYKRDIFRAFHTIELYSKELVSSSDVAEAIEHIGCLAYTGGLTANKCAGSYLGKFAEFLDADNQRPDIKLSILKALSTITLNHSEHQNLATDKGLLKIVANIVLTASPDLRAWAIYCLFCMALSNVTNLTWIRDEKALHETLRMAAAAPWKGFNKNYARVLLKLTSLEPVKSTEKSNIQLSKTFETTISNKLSVPEAKASSRTM